MCNDFHASMLALCLLGSNYIMPLSKSKLIPVGTVDDIRSLTRILSCRDSSLPLKYLGQSSFGGLVQG